MRKRTSRGLAKAIQDRIAGPPLEQIVLKGGDPSILAEAVKLLGPFPVRISHSLAGMFFLLDFPIAPGKRRSVTEEELRGACRILAQQYFRDIQAEAPWVRMKDFKDRVENAIQAI